MYVLFHKYRLQFRGRKRIEFRVQISPFPLKAPDVYNFNESLLGQMNICF